MFSLVFVGADRLGVRGEARGRAPRPAPGCCCWPGWRSASSTCGASVRWPLPLFPVDLLRIPVFALSMGTSVAAFCAQMLSFIALPFLLLDT